MEVERLLSGPLGGDAQIAALVAEHQIAMVIFFRDPLGKHPHEPDVQMLMRVCDVHNVPIATNPASAEMSQWVLLRAKIPTAACGGNREGFLAQRSARRKARPRAEADAGHRKRALNPLPETESVRA